MIDFPMKNKKDRFMSTKLILIEGLDCSGKTHIAKEIAKIFKFRYEHEPTFDSRKADELNFKKLNAYEREFYFMEDRIKHQEILNKHNVVLDRYTISGMAYAKVFAPECFEMVKNIYLLDYFKQPDSIFWVRMDLEKSIEINNSRTDYKNSKLDVDVFKRLNEAMTEVLDLYVKRYPLTPVFIVDQVYGDMNQTVEKIKKEVEARILNERI